MQFLVARSLCIILWLVRYSIPCDICRHMENSWIRTAVICMNVVWNYNKLCRPEITLSNQKWCYIIKRYNLLIIPSWQKHWPCLYHHHYWPTVSFAVFWCRTADHHLPYMVVQCKGWGQHLHTPPASSLRLDDRVLSFSKFHQQKPWDHPRCSYLINNSKFNIQHSTCTHAYLYNIYML